MSNVQVAVRVRPFNDREKAANSECIIQMQGPSTVIRNPALEGAAALKAFSYDYSYWSIDESNPENFADQDRVFLDLGTNILDNAFSGFNCSIFAYGQTGAGKSYSMLGYGGDKGLIPRVCEEMYRRIERMEGPECQVNVEVSFMEIYNENVFDLLNPTGNKSGLKVRNHPTTGPYVEDLSKLVVKDYPQIDVLMEEGSKARTVASTNMNATSSRSHAVFTIVLTITKGGGRSMVSKIHMVDLAGSERATATGASGQRLKEGANINKSLSTLGKVIAALAKKSDGKKNTFVPYRDSVLTWLLKESLGGNSKTIMLAAISPADINFEETLSTLRYADSAKQIKNAAVVNEDPTEKLIRELQEEVERLRALLAEKEKESQQNAAAAAAAALSGSSEPSDQASSTQASSASTSLESPAVLAAENASSAITPDLLVSNSSSIDEIRSQLMQSTKLMATLGKSWETKLKETDAIQKERAVAFEIQGLLSGALVDQNLPNLVNLNEDPLLSGSLVYYLKQGETHVGQLSNKKDSAAATGASHSPRGTPHSSILLGGLGVAVDHCAIINDGQEVWLHPRPDTATFVNGIRVTSPRRLVHGCRVIIGTNHIFRFNHPLEASQQRRSDVEASNGSPSSSPRLSASTSSKSREIDYRFALEERASAEVDALMANTLHFDLTSDEEKLLEKQMKEYYEQKRKEVEDIDKQLEALRKSKDSVLDAIDYEQSRQELVARKMSIDLELAKQKEKFANFSFRVWNEKLERQSLRETITRLVVLIEEANAISKELQKEIHYELHLRSSHPTHAIVEDLFESGFGIFKKILVEVRAIDLRDGLFYDWSHTAFQDLMVELRGIYSSFLTADDSEVDQFLGPPPKLVSITGGGKESPSPDQGADSPPPAPSPFSIPLQDDALCMFTHVSLRDLLYLNHTTIQAPILDMTGKVCGQIHVELDRITSDTSSAASSNDDASSPDATQVDRLVGREIEVVLRINKLSGIDVPVPNLFCSYQFWNSSVFKTEIGSLANDEDESSQSATLNFFHEERFTIANAREDFLSYLENEPLVIELWAVQGTSEVSSESNSPSPSTVKKANLEVLRKAYASDDLELTAQQERKEEKYRMLASVMIQESATAPGKPVDYKNVVTKQEPWNSPSVQFRLRKHIRVPRKVVLQIAQLKDHPISIESCEQVTLTVHQAANSPFGIPASSSPLPHNSDLATTTTTTTSGTSSSAAAITSANGSAVATSQTSPISLKILSVQGDRIEVEWDPSTTETLIAPLLAGNSPRVASNATPRRRGRSSAPPVAAPQPPPDFGSAPGLTSSGETAPSSTDPVPPAALNRSGSAGPGSSSNLDDIPALTAEVEFTLKLNRLATPVKLTKMVGLKFIGAERVKVLSRTVSEAQIIEDLKMKEVLKNEEEQLAMSGSHFQVTLLQFRTVAKRISAMIEEQKFVQKLIASFLLQDRLEKELSLIDKLSTLQKLGNLNRKIGVGHSEANGTDQSAAESQSNDVDLSSEDALPFLQVRYPRTKDDVSQRIEAVKSRISDLSASEAKIDGDLSDVTVQVTTSDVNNRMESKVCGILSKKAGKIWKPRWCVLSKMYFSVYKREDEETPREVLDLTNARINDTTSAQYPNSFAIVNWQNVWFFQAQNGDDFKRWMEALDPERVLRELQASKEKSLQSKLETTSRALKESNDQIKSTSRDLTEAIDTIAKREEEIVVLTFEVEKLQGTIKSLESEVDELQSSMKLLDSKKDSSKESELTEELELQTSLAAEMEEKWKESKKKQIELEDRSDELQSTVDRLQATIRHLESTSQDYTADLNDSLTMAKEKTVKLESQLSELRSQLDEKDDEIRAISKDLAKKEKELERLNANLSSVSGLEEESKSTIAEMRKSHAALADALSETESKLAQKERELARKEKDISSHVEQIEGLEKQVEKLSKDLKKTQAQALSASSSGDSESDSIGKSRIASKVALREDKAEVGELKLKLKKLSESLAEKDREISSLEAEHAKSLRDATTDLKATIDMKDYDLAKKEKEIAKKNSEIQAKSATISELEIELEESRDLVHDLKKQSAAKDKTISDKQREIEKKDKEVSQLKNAAAQFSLTAIPATHPALLSTTSQNTKSEEEIDRDRREAQLVKKDALIAELKEDVEKLSKSLAELKTDHKESKRTVSDQLKELSRREAQILSKDRTIVEMTKKAEDTSREISELEKTNMEQRRTIASKDREIADLEASVESWKDRVDATKRLVDDKQRTVEEKESEIEDLQNDMDELAKEASSVERELVEAGRQIQQLDDACFDLQRRLENAVSELNDARDDNEKAQLIRDHKKQLAQLSQDVSERDRDLEKAEQVIKSLEKSADKRERRIADLEAQLQSQSARVTAYSSTATKDASDVASLKREISSKDAQLKRMQDDLDAASREIKKLERRLNGTVGYIADSSSTSLNGRGETSTSTSRRSRHERSESSSSRDETNGTSSSSAAEKLRSKLEEANKSIARLEAEASRRTSQIERLERDRAAQKTLLSELEDSVRLSSRSSTTARETASTSSSRTDRRVEELQEQLDEAKKEAKKTDRSHKLQVTELQNEIDRMRRRMEQSQAAANSAIRSRQAPASSSSEPEPRVIIETVVDKESEKELAQLREKVITLQSQLREKLSELDDVQFTSRRQDNQVRKSEERFDSEKATLQDRIRSLEQENAKLSAKLSVRLNGSTSAVADADSTPIDWKIRCQQMERELESLRRDIRGSGSKLAKYPDVHTKVLLGEVEVLKESSGTKSHKISELRDKQKEMHTEKIALKTEAVELQKEKAEASKQAATAARQATRLQEQVDTLQSRLEEASKDIKRLRKENDSLADERVSLVLAVKKAQIEVLAATGERLQVVLPSSVESEL